MEKEAVGAHNISFVPAFQLSLLAFTTFLLSLPYNDQPNRLNHHLPNITKEQLASHKVNNFQLNINLINLALIKKLLKNNLVIMGYNSTTNQLSALTSKLVS